jgi:hypothetical protein
MAGFKVVVAQMDMGHRYEPIERVRVFTRDVAGRLPEPSTTLRNDVDAAPYLDECKEGDPE